jgi:predicted nucleic acid-binding protein
LSIDSSVILAYFFGEELGKVAKSSGILPPRRGRSIFCSRTALSEAFYIMCRKGGEDYARASIETLLASSYVNVVSTDEIGIMAGRYKCSRALSLADCYVLAVAKLQHVPALFARKERDLKRELELLPFDIKLLFLEDQVKTK